MKNTSRKITRMLNAMTFAESGNHDIAKEFLENNASQSKNLESGISKSAKALSELLDKSLDKPMVAMTFAEEGFHQEAVTMLGRASMKTVLLVIEGEHPNEAAFNYARNLCKRTGAQLDILQVIDPTTGPDSISVLEQRMSSAVKNIINLIQLSDLRTSLPKLTIRLGEVDSKLVNYVKRHKEVSAIVFDSDKFQVEQSNRPGRMDVLEFLSKKLAVPLMTVLDRNSAKALG